MELNLVVYAIVVIAALLLPLVLATVLRQRVRVPWLLFCVGSLTFVGSQVVHLPLNGLLEDLGLLPVGALSNAEIPLWQTALILGLTAGLCEELTRAVAYALLPRWRRFGDALMMGLGHGGIEAMLLGSMLVAATLSSLMPLRGVDLSTMDMTPEQIEVVKMQLQAFTMPAWQASAPLLERLVAMAAHVTFSVMVWRAFAGSKRRWGYVVLAVGYHALFDYVAVSLSQVIYEPLLGIAALLGLLVPGLVWLFLTRPVLDSNGRKARTALAAELKIFWVAVRHELVYQWRSRRVLIVLAVFGLFGMASPLLAYYMPELIKSMAGSAMYADMIPEPTVADSFTQYIKNLTQFGFILALLLGMGAVVGEKEGGTATMILSKPMPRWVFILSKLTAQTVIYVAAFLVSGLGGYAYTLMLFGEMNFALFALVNLLLLVWLMVFVSVTLLGSVLGKTTGAAAGFSLVGCVVFLLSGYIPKAGPLMPPALVSWAGQLGSVELETLPLNFGALVLALIFIQMLVVASVGVFELQEL